MPDIMVITVHDNCKEALGQHGLSKNAISTLTDILSSTLANHAA
jgi:hypothetical protein